MKDDIILTENFTEIYTYPVIEKSDICINISSNINIKNEFAEDIEKHYRIDDKSNTIITNYIDKNMLNKAESGVKIICLTDTNTTFPEDFKLKLTSRNSEWYDGNWASNLNWKKSSHPYFKNINQDKYFGFEIAQTVPRHVITNIPSEDFTNVIAGMYVGWIQLNSAYIYEMNRGKGKIILCTFPAAKNYSSDPFARTLLDNMIRN